MSEHPRHVLAVTGYVTAADGRVLLVRVARRGWEMPGGQVELGEDAISALRREVEEESGCRVEPQRLIGIYPRLAPPPEMLVLLYRCRHVSGKPQASEVEIPEARWCTREEAQLLVTRPTTAARLVDALADDTGVVYRPYRLDPYEPLGQRTV